MRFFSATETRQRLPFPALIAALKAMFASGCEVPARHVHEIGVGDGSPLVSLIMPAWQTGRCYGVKIVNIRPPSAAPEGPSLHATYLLYDATTGAPLAWIDGDEITARRTAAASALAASWLAPTGARHLAVIGAGRVARLLPEAHRTVRPIERVTVWARSGERAEAMAVELRDLGFDAKAAGSLEAAVAEADIVSCATLATEPLVEGRWLRQHSHLDLIGSFTPAMREADDDCFAGADLYVDTDEALRKSGDLLGPLARGVIAEADVRGTLEELAGGGIDGRRSVGRRTVFKSVGTALEDLAAAMLVYESDAVAPP